MKILFVLTSHDALGDTGRKTGVWLEEFTSPFYVFKDAGAEVTLASPLSGQPPLDPKSDEPSAQSDSTRRFARDDEARAQLAQTLPLSVMRAADYDALFYPGGHGPLWDLAEDVASQRLIGAFWHAGKPISFVCHAPAALRHIEMGGAPLVKGRKVTGFSNSEESAVGLTNVVPFRVEDELKRLGGVYEKGPDWGSFVRQDGNLITGQNPASSAEVARRVLATLKVQA